jgi:uncharacterized membrane protein
MNWAHLHLLSNHIPVLGTLFGLLLLAWGMIRRSASLQRAALATFFVAALVAIPVFLTGEPAEEAVEHLAGTAEGAIETHEDAALLSLISVELLGVIAVLSVIWRRASGSRFVTRAALVMSVVTAGLMARTANLGGKIRHAELRGAASAQLQDEGSQQRGREGGERHEGR